VNKPTVSFRTYAVDPTPTPPRKRRGAFCGVKLWILSDHFLDKIQLRKSYLYDIGRQHGLSQVYERHPYDRHTLTTTPEIFGRSWPPD
jgi:hypothetical protein